MSSQRLKRLLTEKENIHLEFKEAKFALPGNLFETICAMLNRDGGDILLGVNDGGEVTGVDEAAVGSIVTNLINLSNNPQKLDSPFILFPQKYIVDHKHVVHIQVPASSQVHKTAGIIFDRSNDGDFKVIQPQQIAELYNRKRTHYTENIVYPALRFEDFKETLFPKIRNLIRSNNADHPWLALDDKQLLEKAGLWKRDFQTGQEGYTLAAALLLGKDEVITQILPHYKIDALVRIMDLNRYDDRLYIQTNLIEAYELLMDFIAKHLPDKFYLQGDQRVSLRTSIFREVAANLIVHREYVNAHPCTFVISSGKVETENANNPHGEGLIDPNHFTPFPKNPAIAKFFIQLGRVDELGSGVLNVTRFTKQYSGKQKSKFLEGNTFKMIIPVPVKSSEGVNKAANEGVNEVTSEGVSKDIIAKIEKIAEWATIGTTGSIKHKIIRILLLLHKQGRVGTAEIETKTEIPRKTLERYLRRLKEKNVIAREGSAGTGVYILNDVSEVVERTSNHSDNSRDGSANDSTRRLDDVVTAILHDGISDGDVDGVSDGVKTEILQLVRIVQEQEGIRVKEITEKIAKSRPTIERYLKITRDVKLLEFKGAPRTGGYYMTEILREKLTSND